MQRAPFIRPSAWAQSPLTEGEGWSGATSTPSAVGDATATGYAENAIARWDSVPYRTISGVETFGVVAAHMEGIRYVAFSLDDGAWINVFEETTNTDTGERAFCAKVDGDSIAVGQHELRAIAYPYSGVPRVLSGMFLNGNSDGSLTGRTVYVASSGDDSTGTGASGSPYATIGKAVYSLLSNLSTGDGGTVIVKEAGTYSFVNGNQTGNEIACTRYITIRPDEALPQWSVVIDYTADLLGYAPRNYRPNITYCHLQGLVVNIEDHQLYKNDSEYWWVDGCKFTCPQGQHYDALGIDNIRNQGGGLYYTDCVAYDILLAFTTATMARGCAADLIGGDVFQNTPCVLSCDVGTLDPGETEWHTDVCQYFGTVSNVIVRDVAVYSATTSQQVFLDHYLSSHRDVAFINFGAYHPDADGATPFTQLNKDCRHVIFVNCTFGTQDVYLRDDGGFAFNPTNVVLWNCVLHDIVMGSGGSIPAQVRVDYNHFTGTAKGSNYSTGAVAVAVDSSYRITYSGAGASGLSTGKTLPQGLGVGLPIKGARL